LDSKENQFLKWRTNFYFYFKKRMDDQKCIQT